MARQPSSRRPVRLPPQYGPPGDPPSLRAWSDVEARLEAAPNYWTTTVGPDGRPHARPVDGVWVDGALCFGGAPETRWVRNLSANPALSVHLAGETEAIILEGRAELVTDPAHPLAGPMRSASRAKYPQYFGDAAPPFRPFWALKPTTAYAWALAGFPRDATRWRFADP